MTDAKSAKERRIEELMREYRSRGYGERDARYKARRRFEVESGSPGILAWIGGIGSGLASWGLIPIGLWIWERALGTPGHARHVLRNIGLLFTILAAIVAVIVIAVLLLGSGNDGEAISKGRLERSLLGKLQTDYPAVDTVKCESGISAGESVDCLIRGEGRSAHFEISAEESPGRLNLTVDIAE